MTEPFIPTEADIVRTFAVLDMSLGRCQCRQRPGILSDVDGLALCANCASGCNYDVQGNKVPTTVDDVVAEIAAGMDEEERAILIDRDRTTRFCRLCGCTEMNACIQDGEACYWVDLDLCSGCADSVTEIPAAHPPLPPEQQAD